MGRPCGEHAWHAQVGGRDASEPPGFFPFLPEEAEGEVDALDFAEPSLGFGSGSAGQEVGLDLVDQRPTPRPGIR
jgi:hypothetical protein